MSRFRRLRTIGRSNDRVLIAAYDSVEQAELVAAWRMQAEISDEQLVAMATARLRLEALLSECIVLTDTQLLDGAVLMVLAGAGKLSELSRADGQPLPIEIRSREPDLESSLWRTYIGASAPTSFRPAVFDDGDSISGALPSARIPGAGGISGVVTMLRQVGADRVQLDFAEGSWRRLVEMAGTGLLKVVTRAGNLDEELAAARSFVTSDDLKAAKIRTGPGIALVNDVSALGSNRSAAYRLLTQVQESSCEDVREDVRWIRHWFDETYRRVIAFQHEADYRGSDAKLFDPTAVRQIFAREENDYLVEVRLPAGTLSFLSELSVRGWQDFQESHLGWLR